MELLNGEIYGAVNSLNQLFEKDWPIGVSLGLAKLLGKLNPTHEAIEKVRAGLVAKNVPEGAREIKQGDENWDKFMEEYFELMTQKADQIVFEKVNIPSKVNGETVVVNPKIMSSLEKFINVVDGE